MDGTTADEGALVGRNHGRQERGEPKRQHLRDQLSNPMNQANRPEVTNLSGTVLLGDQGEKGTAQIMKSPPPDGANEKAQRPPP